MAWKGSWGGGGGSWGGGGGQKGGGQKDGGNAWQKPAIKPTIAKPLVPSQPAKPAVQTGSGLAPKTGPVYTVGSNSKKDEIGITTLLGDFKEVGSNHGRKYYQKVQEIAGHKEVKVFLYYWDQRDGADFAGWWFGDELGGSQVWARCPSHGNVPPPAGWKIPWDAMKSEPGLLTVSPYKATAIPVKSEKPSAGSSAPPGKGASSAPPWSPQGKGASSASASSTDANARVTKAKGSVDSAEKSAKEALALAKGATKQTDHGELKKVQDALTEQQSSLKKVQDSLTQDVNQARGAGSAGVPIVVEFSKLSSRLRALSTNVGAELNKVKGFVAIGQREAETAKRNAAAEERNKQSAEKNAKDYEESLPAIQEIVNAVEDGVEALEIMATPIIEDPPDDIGNSLKKLLEEIEGAAAETQNRITDCRQQINMKLQASRTFAPDLRKTATAEFTSLQTKIAEVQKKLNPFKSFKKDFAQRIEAKKALADILEKLCIAELEVEKADVMCTGVDSGSQMSEEDAKSAEGLITPALAALANVNRLVEAKLRNANGPLKDELIGMKGRLAEPQKKADGIAAVLKKQREGLALQGVYRSVQEKVEKAEEAFEKCGEAELSFLKGVEVLPQEESEKAIKESDAAAAQTSQFLSQAQSFLKQKTLEVKRYSKERAKAATDELGELQERLDELAEKLKKFKSETQERKVVALMAEAIDSVIVAETRVSKLTQAAKVFSSDNLDDTSVEALTKAIQKTTAADKECSEAVLEARKTIAAKQKTANSSELSQELSKLSGRVNAVQVEITKIKRAAASADKLIKGKEVIAEAETQMIEVEADVEKVVRLTKPAEEGLGLEKVSDDSILGIESMTTAATKKLRVVVGLVHSQSSTAPPAVKASFTKLSDRLKKAQSAIDEVKASTKDQRERVLSESYVRESSEKTDEVEAGMKKVDEAEGPYLKGVDVLPVEESRKALAAAEAAIESVQAALDAARTNIATKNIALRKFDAKNTKDSTDQIVKLTARINAAASTLGTFKKDTESRKKKALLQDATAKVSEVQAEVEKVTEAMKPMVEKNVDDMSPEEASAMIKTLEELHKAAQDKVVDCRSFLASGARDSQGDTAKLAQIKELQTKLSAAQVELSKAKKLSSANNDKLTAKAQRKEADDILKVVQPAIAVVESELKNLDEAGKPLSEKVSSDLLCSFSTPVSVQDAVKAIEVRLKSAVEEARAKLKEQQTLVAKANEGPMLLARKDLQKMTAQVSQALASGNKVMAVVNTCCDKIANDKIQLTAAAVRVAMTKKSISLQDLFQKLSKKGEQISEEAFVIYVQGLEGLDLPSEHAKLLVRKFGAGGLTLFSFARFVQQYLKVVQAIAITSSFDVVGSKDKPIRRAEVDEVVELIEGPKKDDASGLERMKVKAQKDGVVGWVSVKGNQGKIFLEEVDKPCYTCLKEVNLEKDFKSDSGTPIRKVQADEVLEIIEGPNQETSSNATRLRGKALKDNKVGWFTMKDKNGTICAEKDSSYTCTASAAITDDFDVKVCKVLRKLAVGEIFSVPDGPMTEASSGVTRVKGKAAKDGVEGWLTIQGNAGTVYAQVNDKLYNVTKEVSLQQNFASASASIRTVEAGESIEVLEGPREEKFPPSTRAKVQTRDGTVGWITVKSDNMRSWKPFYKYVKAAPLYASKGSKESTVREATPGETLELLEGPVEVEGDLWLKARLKKDSAIGWTPIKSAGARLLVQCP